MKIYLVASSRDIERAELWMGALRRTDGIIVTSTWIETIRKVGHANPPDATREQRRDRVRRVWQVDDSARLKARVKNKHPRPGLILGLPRRIDE